MKSKIGIIGGAGPYASALLYRTIVNRFYTAFETLEAIPEMFILNFPFSRGLTLEESSKQETAIRNELKMCFHKIKNSGADIAAIACNTLHLFLDKADLQGMSFISVPESVLARSLQLKIRKLLILGTQTTIDRNLYAHPLIENVPLNRVEQIILDTVIDRILSGVISEADRDTLQYVVSRVYERESFEGIVLGCTDLPVLHDRFPLTFRGMPILDSIRISADAIYTHSTFYKEKL